MISAAKADVTAQGVAAGKIAASETFIDDGDARSGIQVFAGFERVIVAGRECAPGDHGNAESGEVVRADFVHVALSGIATLGGGVTFDGEGAVPLVAI